MPMNIKRTTERNTSWPLRLWLGQIPLAKAFWLYGILVFYATDDIVNDLDSAGNHGWNVVASIFMNAVCGLEFIYGIVWSVGVWRSSSRYSGSNLWRELTYAAVILQMAAIAKGLVLLAPIAAATLLGSK
jgi:hypothetical protein